MEADDEITFSGGYKDFRLGIRFRVSGKEPAEVASALSFISSRIEPYAFRFSGVGTGKLDGIIKGGKGLGAVYGFLEGLGASGIKSALLGAVPKPELLPAAETYLLNTLLSRSGVHFRAEGSAQAKPEEEEIGDFIGFMGKYRNWVAIKKLGLEKAQDYEVAGILSGVNYTLVNKGFDFSGMKKDDGLVESVVRGKRRAFGNVAIALRELEPKLEGGGSDAYLVCKTLEGIGYKPYASPDMLTDAYPDIKPPKVRGRKPKG
jgi:hypothetical protein